MIVSAGPELRKLRNNLRPPLALTAVDDVLYEILPDIRTDFTKFPQYEGQDVPIDNRHGVISYGHPSLGPVAWFASCRRCAVQVFNHRQGGRKLVPREEWEKVA